MENFFKIDNLYVYQDVKLLILKYSFFYYNFNKMCYLGMNRQFNHYEIYEKKFKEIKVIDNINSGTLSRNFGVFSLRKNGEYILKNRTMKSINNILYPKGYKYNRLS